MTPEKPKASVARLEEKLGYTFQDHQLIKTALMHRSFINEKDKIKESNERLEFLGDAVLGMIVADYLYRTYPDKPEGEYTDLRSALVRRETLAKWATDLGLGEHLYLGRGEARTGGRNRALTLASAFEALLAALYVERGLDEARNWLLERVKPELDLILAEGRHLDFKGLLQKQVQNRYHVAPTYAVVAETGLEHERMYEIEVLVRDKPLGRGSGMTKQIAQQAAARASLELLDAANAEAK
jgi:ribonuclease III